MKKTILIFLAAAILLTACTGKEKKTFDSLASFEGTTVCHMTGTNFDSLIKPVIPNVTFKNFNTLTDLAAAVQGGKVDALATDVPVAQMLVARNQELVVFPETVTEDHYGFAVSKDSALAAPMTAALEKLRENGTLEDIESIWFSSDDSKKVLPTLTHKADFDGSAGTLRYGCDNVTDPMSYTGDGGQPLGYDLDLMTRIAYEMNMTLELKPMNFDALLAALASGKVDVVGGCMSITDERKKMVDFVGPYYVGGVSLVIRKDRLAPQVQKQQENVAQVTAIPEGMPPLETAKIGVMTGTTADRYVEQNYPEAQLQRYDAIPDAMVALQGNKLDYVLTAYTTVLNFARVNKELEILPEKLLRDTCAIAVAKENPELLEQISGVLSQFKQDGTMDAIISNWIKEDGSAYTIAEIPHHDNSAKVLRVGVAANREPMCFVASDGIVGLDAELIERMAYELDMRVEYVDMQFSGLVTALQSGKVDVLISNITPTSERAEKVDFTEGYFDNPQVLVVKRK